MASNGRPAARLPEHESAPEVVGRGASTNRNVQGDQDSSVVANSRASAKNNPPTDDKKIAAWVLMFRTPGDGRWMDATGVTFDDPKEAAAWLRVRKWRERRTPRGITYQVFALVPVNAPNEPEGGDV